MSELNHRQPSLLAWLCSHQLHRWRTISSEERFDGQLGESALFEQQVCACSAEREVVRRYALLGTRCVRIRRMPPGTWKAEPQQIEAVASQAERLAAEQMHLNVEALTYTGERLQVQAAFIYDMPKGAAAEQVRLGGIVETIMLGTLRQVLGENDPSDIVQDQGSLCRAVLRETVDDLARIDVHGLSFKLLDIVDVDGALV
jgi:hypothetical protein